MICYNHVFRAHAARCAGSAIDMETQPSSNYQHVKHAKLAINLKYQESEKHIIFHQSITIVINNYSLVLW